MMVVLYHFHENLYPAVAEWYPATITALQLHGNLGVDVFFVLSGFVIAHSVRDGERSWSYFGRFAFRRSIRLDPPLWATICIELLLIRLSLAIVPELGTPIPHWPQILANLTYTQRFLGLGDIVPVLWSLTFEVQFYVVLVGALVVARQLPRNSRAGAPLFVAAYLYSLFIWLGAVPSPVRGLFIDRWFQFALGIAAWAFFAQRITKAQFSALVVCTVCAIVVLRPAEYRFLSTAAALMTSAALALVGANGRMGTILNSTIPQFLGTISYSLYLLHLSVGWRFITLMKRLIGPELGAVAGTAVLAGAVILSVLAAWMMHALVESPSMRLARRIRLPQRP